MKRLLTSEEIESIVSEFDKQGPPICGIPKDTEESSIHNIKQNIRDQLKLLKYIHKASIDYVMIL